MFQDTPARREHVRKRMRTNAHLAIRHDAWRFMPPGSPRYVGKDVVNYFWPQLKSDQPAQAEDIDQRRDLAAELTELLRLRSELAAIKFGLKLRQLLRERKVYNPNQPRLPAGRREGGQWTTGGETANRLTSSGSASDSGHDEFPTILSVAPDSELRPAAHEIAARVRAEGHHYIPQAVFKRYPFPEETRRVFEEARTGPLLDETTNVYDARHRIYNRATDEVVRQFMEKNNIEPERMTPDQARAAVKEVIDSKDPRIRNLNMGVWSGEIMQRVLRRLRGMPD